jgi:hypothetical protein
MLRVGIADFPIKARKIPLLAIFANGFRMRKPFVL